MMSPSTLPTLPPSPAVRSGAWELLRLGEVPYDEALALQQRCRDEVEAGHPGYWLLLQHPPVVTAGRRAEAISDLPHGIGALNSLGVDFARIERGGRLTFHHPGQIVGYAIHHLRRERRPIRSHVRLLASVMAKAIEDLGIHAEFHPEHPGLWVGAEPAQRKIASIGVQVRRFVTLHGFALNVLRPRTPVPDMKMCGFTTDRITSMEEVLGYAPDLAAVEASLMGRIRDAEAARG